MAVIETALSTRARRVLTLGASTRAIGLAMLVLGAAAQAQTTNVEDPANSTSSAANPNEAPSAAERKTEIAAAETTGEEVIVTGFRESLASAVSAKRNRDLVVEAISAEDIGRLPDASIAESIARLPGLTSQRVSGRSNAISIRGFAPDFSTTLLNGREQTSTGDNRAVEYDQYPSEIISQVLVYKTPQASLVGQGLSGTVDLRTIRPIEFGRRVFSVGARGTYVDSGKLNAGSREYGYRVNGTFVDQFADDSMGVALSASYTDEPYQNKEFNAWGYTGTPSGAGLIGGEKSYVTSSTLKRLGIQGTFEWRMSDTFTSTIDGFYSDFKERQIKRGIELPLGFNGNPLSNVVERDGLVVSGTFANVEGVVRNDLFQRNAKLYAFGYNGSYKGDDGWNAFIDLSYSRTDRNELVLESNAGTGRGAGVGAQDTINFTTGRNGSRFQPTLNYGDYNLIKLTSPLGWGGDQIAPNGARIRNGQDGYYNNRIIDDELYQLRAEVEREFEGGFLSSIQLGANYTDHKKSLTPDEYFLGLVANTDGATDVVVPEQFRKGTSNLGFLGLGPVISYNPLELLDAGIYQLVPNPYGDVVVKAYSVREKLMTIYGQGNIKSDLGFGELTGNFGVQAIFTDQNSSGASAIFLGTNPNGSPNIGGLPRNVSEDYVDVLPSVNLSLRFDSGFVIRAALAREIIRPRLDDMRASFSYSATAGDPGPGFATPRGSSGNPLLRPWRANAADLTFEQYFGQKGYIAAQFFYKDLKSYIYNADLPFDYTGLPFPPAGNLPNGQPIVTLTQGTVNVPINGQGGELYGVELAGTLAFGDFVSALDGFGITGGASYTKTKIQPTPGAPSSDIPGYSKWVANGTAFFEKWGFSARGSVRYRSSFIGEVSGFGAARTRRRAISELIVDGQIGYDFTEGTLNGLSLFIQGQNLTDEPFITIFPPQAGIDVDFRNTVIDYQKYGRRFLAGFTYKF